MTTTQIGFAIDELLVIYTEGVQVIYDQKALETLRVMYYPSPTHIDTKVKVSEKALREIDADIKRFKEQNRP